MLTDKEIAVLRLAKRGILQKDIAKRLKISQPAVSSFYNNALRKIKDARKVIKIAKEVKHLET